MVNNYPIPKYLLIHNIEVKPEHESQAGALHPIEDEKGHVFKFVRVQPKDTSSHSSTGPDNKGSHLLFIDYQNSINVDDYLIRAGDTVIWNGTNRKVIGISALYGLNPDHVHHWEVNLE
ncbi:putative minor capsid protein [Companilactobacillus muriivasis]|uniref:putative minor capsid protein n=1 Tax=Companilactobacillus muriivasis TaxID=3081444 RepID=UPI0030C68B70